MKGSGYGTSDGKMDPFGSEGRHITGVSGASDGRRRSQSPPRLSTRSPHLAKKRIAPGGILRGSELSCCCCCRCLLCSVAVALWLCPASCFAQLLFLRQSLGESYQFSRFSSDTLVKGLVVQLPRELHVHMYRFTGWSTPRAAMKTQK